MNRIIPFAVLLLLLSATACREELVPSTAEEGVDMSCLRFFCDDLETKSDESVGLAQERVLNSLDVYFYADGETDQDAVYHWRNDMQDCYTTYNAHIDFLASDVAELFHSSATCEVLAIANMPASALPGNDTPLTGSSMPTLLAKKVQSVFGSAAGTNHIPDSFVMVGTNTIALTSRAQTTVATGTIPLYRLAAKLELLVHVQDTIHLRTTWKDDDTGLVYIAEEIWRPMTVKQGTTAQVEAYLENGYKEAALGVREDPASHMVQISTTTPMTQALTAMFFKYSKNKMPYDSGTTVTMAENKRWTYSDYQAGLCALADVGQNVIDAVTGQPVQVNNVYMYSDPSYTYPVTWSRGVEKEPFFKLCFPWSRDSQILVYKNGLHSDPVLETYKSAQKQYYYKIMFPVNALESNNFYRFKINVAILGSETDDALVTMEPTYAVAGWQNKTEVLEEAEVGNARYLSVAQSAYTLYNEPTLSIPYVTSDECEIVNVSWVKPYYGTGNTGSNDASGYRISTGSSVSYPQYAKVTSSTVNLNSSGESTSGGTWEFKLSDNKTIEFKHNLNNTQSTTQDVSPYIITFTIRHKDLSSYSKQVTITQYPAIYMEQKEGGNVFIDGYFGNVNGGYSNNYANHSYGTSYVMTPYRTSTKSLSNSGNLTRITVSAFNSDYKSFSSHLGTVDYIIGDPRVASGWSNSDLIAYGSLTGTPSSGQNNVTTNNWSTKAGKILVGTSEPQLIAPSIYIASFWGAMNSSDPITFDEAKKRCATYQEAGYPAGRWRLPTEAEVNYVQSLQRNGFINTLFNDNYYYQTSSGYSVKGSNNSYTQSVSDPGVRCVYDVWYWGDTQKGLYVYHPDPE